MEKKRCGVIGRKGFGYGGLRISSFLPSVSTAARNLCFEPGKGEVRTGKEGSWLTVESKVSAGALNPNASSALAYKRPSKWAIHDSFARVLAPQLARHTLHAFDDKPWPTAMTAAEAIDFGETTLQRRDSPHDPASLTISKLENIGNSLPCRRGSDGVESGLLPLLSDTPLRRSLA
nr:hypothetical protein B24P7.230 [imported] - Neurospora crassa [Neurospora crassa]